MGRTSPLIWFLLLLLLFVPTTAGRFLLDLAGGLMLVFVTLPFILAGAGWLGWRYLQSRLVVCETCGASSLRNESGRCPICGSDLPWKNQPNASNKESSFTSSASTATIDVTAKDVENDS